ncbi:MULTISPECIES: hypothetical protein [Desertifilum]|uniref:Dual OB-containing domain-containing protein n=2 Tax=Desertifilum tharense IPPAS B-1220 TaxID=1781255 RepID=A0A1E5QJV4_9CYAN|nr:MULTISPECIES: hypothetical protein [Desertifilum]MDA0212532.1 hypothetical protein [Cyanobacteria bacterium FC1]OEJ74623.1 hypothetical protein BH720_13705 [Desertifilum tharense IPPAS B-1220]
MVKIICLANSWKYQERCIAGINLETGEWVRPVCSEYPDGRVPQHIRLIQGIEPALLDIIDIPLGESDSDYGFSCENVLISDGCWRRVKSVAPTAVLQYCQDDIEILHNSARYVEVAELQYLPFRERQTLQLVYTPELKIERYGSKWKGSFVTSSGKCLTKASITDPVFIEKLASGYRPQNPCLITVSLSMPFRPSEDWEGEPPCWKLIAGVIELSDSDRILVEMQRLGWSIEQGRQYLQEYYGKRSRSELTCDELQDFLRYLTSV